MKFNSVTLSLHPRKTQATEKVFVVHYLELKFPETRTNLRVLRLA